MSTTSNTTSKEINARCSVASSLEVLGEKWALLVVREAFFAVTRAADFRARLGIAPAALGALVRGLGRRGGDLFQILPGEVAPGDAEAVGGEVLAGERAGGTAQELEAQIGRPHGHLAAPHAAAAGRGGELQRSFGGPIAARRLVGAGGPGRPPRWWAEPRSASRPTG